MGLASNNPPVARIVAPTPTRSDRSANPTRYGEPGAEGIRPRRHLEGHDAPIFLQTPRPRSLLCFSRGLWQRSPVNLHRLNAQWYFWHSRGGRCLPRKTRQILDISLDDFLIGSKGSNLAE